MTFGPGTHLRWLGPNDARAAELVETLQRRGTLDDVYPLALAFVRSPNVSVAARRAIGAIFDRANARDLPTLDASFRYDADDDDHLRTKWSSIAPDEVERVAEGIERTGVLGLLSMHRNGHVRERAVMLLATCGADALPWLLVRTLDWVSSVRELATRAIVDAMRAENADAMRALLPLVERVRAFTRVDRNALADRIESFIAAQPVEVLERGLASVDRLERRVVLDLLDRRGLLATAHLARAIVDPDLAIRIVAARMLIARRTAETAASARRS